MIDVCKRLYNSMEDPKVYRTSMNDGLHPSSTSVELPNGRIAGGCHREIYYKWKGFKGTEDQNVEYTLAAEFGNWLHEGIQEYMRRHVAGTDLVVLSAEQSFCDPANSTLGTSDLFLMDLNTKETFGVDIKTVGEWAGKACLEQPSIEALMQCAIYMDQYQQTSRKGYKDIDYWVILYVSRDENWDLKARKHGSIFRFMWQFWMMFEDDMVVVYDQKGNRQEYPEITLEAIRKRNNKILQELKQDTLPDRDFEVQYTEEYLTSLWKADQFKFKKDIAVIEKWYKKGAKKGELTLEMGDKQCRFCSYQSLCYSDDPTAGKQKERKLFSLKKETTNRAPSSQEIML